MRAERVGFQIEHRLLHHIRHLAAGAKELFIQGLRAEARPVRVALEAVGRQVGDDETRVVAGAQHLGFTDDPPRPAPAFFL